MSNEKRTLVGMIAGIGMFLAAGLILCLFFLPESLPVMGGLVFGSAGAAGLACHMYHTLDVTLSLPEKDAVSYGRRQSFLRMFIMLGMLAISARFDRYVNLLGTFPGLLFLKFAAYLQPTLDKWIFSGKGR